MATLPVIDLHNLLGTLQLYCARPKQTFYAAAGPDYGMVTAWELHRGYLVEALRDKVHHSLAVVDVLPNLADFLIPAGYDLEHALAIANVKGPGAILDASQDDDGPFYVLVTRYWSGKPLPGSPAITTTEVLGEDQDPNTPRAFHAYRLARHWILAADDAPLTLEQNEMRAPTYSIVTGRGRSSDLPITTE